MIIKRENLKSWVTEAGGIAKLELAIADIGPAELLEFLERMHNQLDCVPGNETHLVFSHPLSAEQCAVLVRFIDQHVDALPFSRLSLCVDDPAILEDEVYGNLFAALNKTFIKKLHIQNRKEHGDRITEILEIQNDKKEQICYPITLSDPSYSFKIFTEVIIHNIQQRNAIKGNANAKTLPLAAEICQEIERKDAPSANKIKLKALIEKQDPQTTEFDQYIKLEVQHVEIEEHAEIQEVEEFIEEKVVEIEQQVQERYEGELIGYREFQRRPYSDYIERTPHFEYEKFGFLSNDVYQGVRFEYFGNLPKAIKYLSPTAALVIAKHKAEFETLNADNLPQNFLLKKTANGELVLDYDLYAPERGVNVFTPIEIARNDDKEPIYEVELPFNVMNEWIFINPNNRKHLDNLWIKHGIEGVRKFFAALRECDNTHSDFSAHFFNRYLCYFPHWDHFLDDDLFLDCINRIKNYKTEKYDCLLMFLERTGSSRHDLTRTLAGFDVFWEEWETMCLKNKISTYRINVKWKTPVGGNPLVYMERMLVILKNTRNLNEQLDHLDGLLLDNYGAYYASKYEGFKFVSPKMDFSYYPERQNQVAFNQDAYVYRVELETMRKLVESHVSEDRISHGQKSRKRRKTNKFYALAYRYLGMQAQGIPMSMQDDIAAFDGITKMNFANEQYIQELFDHLQSNIHASQAQQHFTAQASRSEIFSPPDDAIKARSIALGERDLVSQFDTTHVERVVNSLVDLNHRTVYTYTYRKQMMEAFLFINKAGHDLPIYKNKPARELSNKSIQKLFLKIKSKNHEFSHLTAFQRRLYALGLMREAMYRSTGQFPYSTQIIAIIDCMMHQGDIISNSDAGQGKSLIDAMKAALLWLDSDRVDVTTSSMVDARRDVGIYAPFFSLLGIPFASKAIAASSPFTTYQPNGVNYSTMAQLALFYSKAKGEGVKIGKRNDIHSAVMNESDYTILSDKTIYRYATSSGAGVGAGNEWIYTAINDFVRLPQFVANNTSEKQDIALLKKYIAIKARDNRTSPKIANKFSDVQLRIWIESAILVNYRLREKRDYLLTPDPEERVINGVSRLTRVAKILMSDGKVSPDTLFGEGMQQLLHAKLNETYGENCFVIEPECKTIISLNNRNMIDYYQFKQGFIWGSSATVGSDDEIRSQHAKYGFEFSEIAPHQKKRVIVHEPVIFANEDDHFNEHIRRIIDKHLIDDAPPALVFCKDIETAERFYAKLKATLDANTDSPDIADRYLQLYTGLNKEEQIIQNAAKPGMVTVTTSALGRNTDVQYALHKGMTVFDSFVDTTCKSKQRAGRTGRQGSPGDVYVILNQADFPGLTIEQAIKENETRAEKEREFNEELYNIIGYFIRLVERRPKEFFRNQWAAFSKDIETCYRQQKVNRTYQLNNFVTDSVNKFNEMSGLQVRVSSVLTYLSKQYPQKQINSIYKKPVTITECTPPYVMAYHFVNYLNENTDVNIASVEANLRAIFSAKNPDESYTANKSYIDALNMIHANPDIRAMHQRYISNYLRDQANLSKHRRFFSHLFEHEGLLNKIASNENYLIIFKALTDIPGDEISDVETTQSIKLSVTTLLEEYLQYSWFISAEKIAAAKRLIAAVNVANSSDEVMAAIQHGKINIGQADIETNQQSFWRRKVMPANAKGYSRLQMTLDRALKLTSVLTHKKIDIKFIDVLAKQLTQVVAPASGLPQMRSIDTFKHATAAVLPVDTANANVVMQSLETALNNNARFQQPVGMIGRHELFRQKKHVKSVKPTNDYHPEVEVKAQMPIWKKVLIGAAIGLGVVVVSAAIVTLLIYTGGAAAAPLSLFGLAMANYLGIVSASAPIFGLASFGGALAVAASAVSAFIGGIIGVCQKRPPVVAAEVPNEYKAGGSLGLASKTLGLSVLERQSDSDMAQDDELVATSDDELEDDITSDDEHIVANSTYFASLNSSLC